MISASIQKIREQDTQPGNAIFKNVTKPCLLLFSFMFLSFYSGAQAYPVVKKINNPPLFNEQLQFFSWRLLQPNTEVRILIYGQSISAQDWWKEVKIFFEKKYPHTSVIVENKAIGGFSTERLKLMVENDVVPFYPDLILLHDYGNEPDYEKIIRTIRKRTTADIAVQTDHMAVQDQTWHDRHSNVWLSELCKKYGLALLDIRQYWKQYLDENRLAIKDLLTDGVHLNKQGNYLMAGIIKNYFETLSFQSLLDHRTTILKKGKDFFVKKRFIRLNVTGNRVDISSDKKLNEQTLQTVIEPDGLKDKSTCFYYSRPSLKPDGFFLTHIGLLLAMELTQTINENKWHLSILSVDSIRQEIRFSLKSDSTDEGSGSSNQLFTSRSGSIVIKPEFWFMRRNKGDFAQFNWLKAGDVLHWETKSLCSQSVRRSPKSITLFQGIENSKHQITISGARVKRINKIIVFKPILSGD